MNTIERAAQNLIRALTPFPNLTATQIRMICQVAIKPGLSGVEHARHMGIAPSEAQRQLHALVKHKLVDAIQDRDSGVRWQEGGNRKANYLSETGRALLAGKDGK